MPKTILSHIESINASKEHLRVLGVEQSVFLVGAQESRIVPHLQRALANGGEGGLEKKQFPTHVLDHALGRIQGRACRGCSKI